MAHTPLKWQPLHAKKPQVSTFVHEELERRWGSDQAVGEGLEWGGGEDYDIS
jgi:hypothetical protein